MVDYSSQVKEAASEESPADDYQFQDLLKRRAAAVAKMYGQAGSALPAPSVDLADERTAQQNIAASEYDRRKAAATGAYDYAQKTGQAAGDLSERIRAALFQRKQTDQEISDTQRQQLLGADQAARQANQEFSTATQKLGFNRYKTDGDRLEAMNMAWKQGTLKMDMLEAARDGSLMLSDIDKMFQIKYSEMENDFKDWSSMKQAEQDALLKKWETDASNTSSIISGITGTVGTGIAKAME